MSERLIIWGASGHMQVVVDIVRLVGKYEIVGALDDVNLHMHGCDVGGVRILGGAEQLEVLRGIGVRHLIVAIGDCSVRSRLAGRAAQSGFELPTAIHPRAVVSERAEIGKGTVVAGGAVINALCRIGENVIVNTSASVDHECRIGGGVHIGPGAHLGGRVNVEDGAWIGIGAIIRDRINIGTNAIVGAGAVITKDVPANVVVYGVPGRVIRSV